MDHSSRVIDCPVVEVSVATHAQLLAGSNRLLFCVEKRNQLCLRAGIINPPEVMEPCYVIVSCLQVVGSTEVEIHHVLCYQNISGAHSRLDVLREGGGHGISGNGHHNESGRDKTEKLMSRYARDVSLTELHQECSALCLRKEEHVLGALNERAMEHQIGNHMVSIGLLVHAVLEAVPLIGIINIFP